MCTALLAELNADCSLDRDAHRRSSDAHRRISLAYNESGKTTMKNTKFVVKVNRSTRATEYVKRVDLTPIQMTPNLKLALVMGRFTAEDAVKSLQNSRCSPELVSVEVFSPEVAAPR
jgi:hypothetical protein